MPKKFDKESLSDKEKAFIAYYTTHWNGKRAAQQAGYSEKNPAQVAYSLLHYNQRVRKEIAKVLAQFKMSRNEVLARLSAQAAGSLEPFLTKEGAVDLTTDEAQENLFLLKKVKTKQKSYGTDDDITTERETEIEIHDAQAALVHMGRHYGLFVDKSVTGEDLYKAHMELLAEAIKHKRVPSNAQRHNALDKTENEK